MRPGAVLLVAGVAIGIVVSSVYHRTSYDINHRCVRSHVEEVPTADGDTTTETVCDFSAKTGPAPSPIKVVATVPSDFILGKTGPTAALLTWAVIGLVVVVPWAFAKRRTAKRESLAENVDPPGGTPETGSPSGL